MGKFLWMMVSRDKYALPEAIADTCEDLAQLVGSTYGSIYD